MKLSSIPIRKMPVFSILATMFVLLVGCTQATSSGILIKYQQTGGFAGLDNHLTIKANGEAVLIQNENRFEFILDDNTLQSLQQKFEEIQFSKMDKKYIPDNTCCDLIEYTITYQGHTVKTMDTAVPEALWGVIEPLNEIVVSGRKS